MVKCCIDVSRGTAYGLLLAQIIFALACILYSPHREITVYTLKTPTNTTHQLTTHEVQVHVQWFLACLSFLAFFFSTQTMHFTENDSRYRNEEPADYNTEFVEQAGLWNTMFWSYCLGAHLLLLGIVLQVCDVYLLVLAAIMQVYALYKICLPRNEHMPVHMTRENLNLIMYLGAAGLVFNSAQKPDMLMWIVILDYALGAGHTWDREATVDTIVNCRLFYMCSLSLLLCVYYTIQ